VCPVCGLSLGRVSNAAMNAHVDLCLNRPLLAAADPTSDRAPAAYAAAGRKRAADADHDEGEPSAAPRRAPPLAVRPLTDFFGRTTRPAPS
jgi:hypothetical protein